MTVITNIFVEIFASLSNEISQPSFFKRKAIIQSRGLPKILYYLVIIRRHFHQMRDTQNNPMQPSTFDV